MSIISKDTAARVLVILNSTISGYIVSDIIDNTLVGILTLFVIVVPVNVLFSRYFLTIKKP